MTAWAFAKAGHSAQPLLKAIATEAVRGGLRDFNPQNLANADWSGAPEGAAAAQVDSRGAPPEKVQRGTASSQCDACTTGRMGH